MPTLTPPTTERIAEAWMRAVPGVPDAGTSVPADVTKWQDSGFVQVTAVGGTSSIDIPVVSPVVAVDCWAVNPGSKKSPWGKANELVEFIRAGTFSMGSGRLVTIGDEYGLARLMSVYMLSEPTRVTRDPAGYARYNFDLALHWVAL